MEEKIEKLYELLENGNLDNETSAALKWAIFELESKIAKGGQSLMSAEILKNPTIIKVRRGINCHRYSACDANGYFLGNFNKLSEVRAHWNTEIRRGQVTLVRELNKEPDLSMLEESKKYFETILKSLAKKNNSRNDEE